VHFDASSWVNLYNGQITGEGLLYNRKKLVYYDISPKFNKPRKKQGIDTYCCNGDTIGMINIGWGEDFYDSEEVCMGLGRVYDYYEFIYPPEAAADRDKIVEELKAYRKGDETYGTFSNLCDLLDTAIMAEMRIPMNDTTITKNDSLVITLPNYFDSYNWSNGSDSNTLIIASADYDAGTYQFTVEIGYYGCFRSDTISVTIKDSNGYPDLEKEPSVVIEYRASGSIVVVNKSKKELDYCLQLVDQSGKLIKEERCYGLLPSSRTAHYINDISKGFYIVHVRTDTEIVSRKIVR
jgi:hypothetical protein